MPWPMRHLFPKNPLLVTPKAESSCCRIYTSIGIHTFQPLTLIPIANNLTLTLTLTRAGEYICGESREGAYIFEQDIK